MKNIELIDSVFQFGLIDRDSTTGFELWKAHEEYLICYKYLHIFEFYRSLEKAKSHYIEYTLNPKYTI